MSKSRIEWTHSTWPVVTGCTHAGGPGCDNCYAARMAATRLKHHPRYEGLATIKNGKARWTGKVNLNHDALEQPLHWQKPRMVFVASMGDLFHKDVPFEFIDLVFLTMTACNGLHMFQVLTKRPERMLEYFNSRQYYSSPQYHACALPNVWLGTSIENQAAADERIPLLLQTPAAVHYVSVEPMLEVVDLLRPYYLIAFGDEGPGEHDTFLHWLDWVICGGESGPGARPMHPDWARSLQDQCQTAGTPYFFKQHGAWLHASQQSGQSLSGPHHWWGKGALDAKDISYRVGKKRAGHLLDGRTWQEFPVQPTSAD